MCRKLYISKEDIQALLDGKQLACDIYSIKGGIKKCQKKFRILKKAYL